MQRLQQPVTRKSTEHNIGVLVFRSICFLCTEKKLFNGQPFIAESELVKAALLCMVCLTDDVTYTCTWVVAFSDLH